MDRISNFPVDIIHQILSSLSIKDATRTSVLSKRWRSIWDSRPYIYFDESLFWSRRDAFRTYLLKFLDTRDKQCENNPCVVDKLFLHMEVEDYIAEYLVKQLIEYALKNKVKALDLSLPMSFGKHYYVLVAATLVELNFQKCQITDCSFVLPSLKSLSLRDVHIEDKLFADLIDGCPQIEWLHIEGCSSLSIVVVSNSTLKFFGIVDHENYCEIQVKSPYLESLEFGYLCERESEVEISSTTTVKSLILRHVTYDEISLAQFIGQFSLLEKLVIHHWSVFSEIEEITIDAPKLKSFKFSGNLASFSGIKASKELEFVKFNLEPERYDSVWYIWLRDSLESFAHVKHLRLKCLDKKAIMFPDKLAKKLLPINDIKHLELKILRPSATTQEILDGFIWILPSLKTLKLTLGSKSKLIKFPHRE